MRAVVLTLYGGPDRLKVSHVEEPQAPGPDDLLIRTAAAAVNPVDLQTRAGLHARRSLLQPPMVLGWDVSGTVTAVGGRVTAFRPGDRVVAMSAQMATGRGTYAETVTVASAVAAPAPVSVPLVTAAGLPLAGLTALQALDVLALPEGAVLLVTGAAGSVGGTAVQLARLRGLTVLAHVRTGQDAEQVRELGAHHVVVGGELLTASGPRADALLETAGLPQAIGAVRDHGRAVSIVPTRVPVAERGIEVSVSHVEQDGARLAELTGLLDRGALRLRFSKEIGFDDACEAHRLLEAGGVRGKLLLVP
ncbi:NADP-dependent oxidoreductase [Streptomyces minutiscleroticus]|uniref:NADPH:quinone reductase n=1 Tax=Streptomyces minutiscleroticus TaxID=68238 RepID=A0A918P176_9ACTN|nr:NADP-dependent oxidoreductase [Streptomyces minutiscleroticus]GGY12488.1 NADPH:quinone reductase [Streptomyces minutiscleroticus]